MGQTPSAFTFPWRILLAVCTPILLTALPAAAQVSILTGRTVDNVFTLFDPSSNALPNGNPNIPNHTPPLKFMLARPSVLVISFSSRVATDNPGGTQPPYVVFTAVLDGHPLLLCLGCNPSSYESTTVLGAFDTKTIKWVTSANAGPHAFEVAWDIHNPGIATVSVKTVVIEAARK